MRRVVAYHRVFQHNHSHLSPLSLVPLINPRNRCSFSTKKNKSAKKSKIKIAEDEYDAFGADATENIQEATVEKETAKDFRKTASKTISNIQFSDDDHEAPKTMRDKLNNYISVHILGLDNILPRMIALRDKDPKSISQTMKAFWIANAITGIPFFLLCWQCSSYIVHPELILAYFVMRYTANYPPGSTINTKLVQLYKLKYPLLKECNWSRKMPDPSQQNVDAVADNLGDKIPFLQKMQTFLDNDKWKVGNFMKGFRQRVYENAIKHGFAWDIADNVRIIVGLPLLFTLLHEGGVGLYFSDLDAYNPWIAQWICIYIGSAYGARVSSNWALRTMVLTVIEKRFGLRGDSGEYYGYKKSDKNVNRKSTMSDVSDTSESVSNAKVSSRKPKRK